MSRPLNILLPLLAVSLAACSGARPIPSEDIRRRAAEARAGAEREARPAAARETPAETSAKPAPKAAATAAPSPTPDARAPEKPAAGEKAPDEPEVKVLEADAAKGCTWVESKASVDFGESEAKNQAEARAVTKALVQAMHKFLGQELTHNFVDYQQEGLKDQVGLTQSLLRVTQPGLELDRRVLFSGPEDLPGCTACRYGAKLRTCLAPRKGSSDKDFRTELKLNRTRFVNGDPAELYITATRDAYVYIYDIDTKANAALIFPDAEKGLTDNRLRAGETFTFPSEEHKRRLGAKFAAELPRGSDVSAEVIRIVASKSPIPQSVLEGGAARGRGESEVHGTGSFLGIMQRLNASDIDWAEDVQAFTIYKE